MENGRSVGEIQIADEVVANIAGLAAMEAEGVAMKAPPKSVKVDVLDTSVSVDLSLNIEYGYNIPEVCTQVQERVKTAIENMTGLSVIDVNIKISGVNIDKTR